MGHFNELLHRTKDKQLAAKSTSNDSAAHIAERTYQYFYSPKNAQWQARVKSHGTLGDADHFGYTVWSVIMATQALADCQLSNDYLRHSLQALQTYWNPEKHAFCAWKYFVGNEDIYFDDNAHAVNALISVFQTTQDLTYLKQAKDILTSLLIPAAESSNGAIPWHISDYTKRHACSTGPAAVAALRIHNQEEDHPLLAFAEKALLWLTPNLQDPKSGLIWDHMSINPDGSGHVSLWCWSYNTGFAIHGFSLLYEATGQQEHLDAAIKLAGAATNPDNCLIDDHSPDGMYTDGSFFLHHLVDGFLALSKHTMTDRLHDETRKIADWGRVWMFDPKDGMFFRGSKPYSISEDLTKRFNESFGTEKELEKNGEERGENGGLCKTLLGNAGWVRIFKMVEGLESKDGRSSKRHSKDRKELEK